MEWLLRTIFHWIDSAVFKFIGMVYDLLIEIAETTIISEDLISEFSSRVYALLGIFMLFKVSFSILNYIVNPDDFTDKSKGFSKIITNIMISLTLLVVTPWIFSKAFEIQRIVLRDNVLGNLILGSSGGISSNISTLNPGKNISFQALKAFYYLDEETYPACSGIYNGGLSDDAKATCKEKAFGNDENADDMIEAITLAADTKSVSIYLRNGLETVKDNRGDFTMTYTPIISTIVGAVIALLLVVFCFDIAVRSIKLGFMQLIAPIPIISRIDPKSSKDGMFNKWVKECTKIYLDLFIRLLAIYFAVYIISSISLLNQYNAITGESTGISPLAKVFIILGALMFAKQLPQIIQDLTGFKMEGKFTLNPLKKLDEVPIVTGAAAGLVAGGVGGMIRGGFHNKGFAATRDAEVQRRHNLQLARANGSHFWNRGIERTRHALGMDSDVDRLSRAEAEITDRQREGKEEMERNKQIADAIGKMEDRAKDRIKTGAAGHISEEYVRRQEGINSLRSQMEEASRVGDTNKASALAAQIAKDTTALNTWLEDTATYDYIDNFKDGTMDGFKQDYEELARVYGQAVETTAAARHSQSSQNKTRNSKIQRGFTEMERAKREIADQKARAEANIKASQTTYTGGKK